METKKYMGTFPRGFQPFILLNIHFEETFVDNIHGNGVT